MNQPGRRLRIAVLNRVFSPTGGGAERYSIALVEQLAARHDIHVFAQQIDHVWPGVTYHQISTPLIRPRWVNLIWYSAATWWATRYGFDVVHSHESTWHGQVNTVHVLPIKYSLYKDLRGWHLFFRYLKVIFSPRLLAYLLLEKIRFISNPSLNVVVVSHVLKEIMELTYTHTKPVVISPGVTLPPEHGDKNAARQLLNLPLQGRLLAFIANDYQKKGLSTLLQALTLLPQDVQLAVVGNPKHINIFQEKAKVLGLESRVYFLGHLLDVSPLYVASNVFAHPTTEDTFGMVVLEAMAHGLPVVVTDEKYCGISSLLTNDVNAVIISDPNNAQELANSILNIFDDAERYKRLANAARKFASNMSWSNIANQQERIYFKDASSDLKLTSRNLFK